MMVDVDFRAAKVVVIGSACIHTYIGRQGLLVFFASQQAFLGVVTLLGLESLELGSGSASGEGR